MKTPSVLALLLVAAVAPVVAQQPRIDPRWEAWLGCWTASSGAMPSPTGKAPTVCVIPATGGVDVLTVVDTSVVTRDHIEVAAAQHPVEREGCTGWETDVWSRQGDRLYRRSEYTCAGDVKRATSELFAITPEWEWLDVQGLSGRGDMGVRTLRYRIAVVPAVPEIATALAGHAGVSIARGAAATPPTADDAVEASRAADPAVVEAWLAEDGAAFPLSGKELLALADSGVPGNVIDVMVAMTYPKVFTVAAPSARGGLAGAQASRRSPAPDTMYDGYRHPYYGLYSLPYGWGWDYYSPWSWSLYGYYSPYFYSPYGQFSPYYWGPYGGGYYYGGGTVVVVTGSGASNPPPPHGRIVKGHGYQYGDGSAGTAHQSSGSNQSSNGASSSAGSAPQPSPPPSSRSSGSGQVGQHAKPRP